MQRLCVLVKRFLGPAPGAPSVYERLVRLLVLAVIAAVLGAAGQIQVFRVRPENVQVRAGDDVFLKCVVENQQGKAQWTKDGFALGFERGVPGYPRYQYAGEASAGEHHLVIKGITLEDDGEYQCQVGPTTSSLPIWAAANVTVMVPPSSIVMLGRSEGEVVEVKAGERLQLECLVSDARPVPNVTWHRDDHRIEPKLQTDMVQPSVTRRRLLSVVSRLVLTATEEDDGEELSCRTQHPALKDAAAPAQPLTASVTLSVLHPPGKPVIHGYKTGEVLRAGERRTLTCRVLGGNPRPWVTWYWHGLPLNHTAKSKSRKSVYLKAKATSRKGKKTRGVSVTQQVTASRTEDGAVYECRVSSDLLQRPLTTNVTLTVHYAPAQVRVSGSTVVAAGEEFSLTCVTSPANPPASITWLVDGAQVNTTTTRESKDEGGGWVTTALLTQEAARSVQVREMVVTCQAHHLEAVEAISHTRGITVIRAPGAPVIEVQARGQLVAGTNLDVSCTSKGGHPPPQFRIYKGGDQELETETQTSGNTSRARASFRAAPADNGAHLTCAVTNPALATPLVVNTTLSLLFAPWEVRGTASPQSVEAGQVVKLTCETSASVPASSVTWHSRAHLLGDPSVRHSPGLFGGTVTRSEVKIRTEAEDNGQEVTCRAENGLGISVTGNITLEVLHGPVWIRVPSGTLNVLEGKEETLTAAAMANPGPITYSWWRGNDEVGGVESRGGELRMGVLSRRHAHNYTVTARSPKGALTSAFFLNVQYGPEDVVTEERVTIEQGGSASILCSAGGNPTPNVTWTRDADNTSAPLVMSSGVGEARLVVERASRTDSSVYLCHASSSVSSAPPASSILIVQQAPWWPSPSSEEVVGGSWAALGGSGRLECRMRAAPEPTFHWATQDGRDVQAGHKYTLQDAQLSDGVVEWTSVVEIREVTPGDYGRYVCSAANALGKHSVPLVLSPPVPPATPSHLTVENVSSDEVWLHWTPNLSRTRPSGYIVRYQRIGGAEYQYVNVSGGERTSVVVEELAAGTRYSISVQAYNMQGLSQHTHPLTTTTLGVAESASSSTSSSEGGARSRVPRLILLIMTLAGTALLALNMAIIACFVRRRAAHNARGVSASSSKTTTLEVFSPATTPGGTTQGDELPLTTTTTTTTDLTTIGGERIECQTGVDDGEQTSLFHGDVGDTPVLTPDEEFLRNTSFRSRGRSQQNGRVLAQNGGHTLQKYRDDSSYYYSPIPQNNYIPGDESLVKRTTNPPDVCPTTSDSAGTLNRRKQQQQQQQQRGTTTPSCPADTLGPLPVRSPSPSQGDGSRQSPGDQIHDHHNHHNHQPQPQPQQQQTQKWSSPREGGGQQLQLSHPQVQHLDPHTHNIYDVTLTPTGVPRGYATVGPRKHRQTPPSFSTLQRPGAPRPFSTTATSTAVGQLASPMVQEVTHVQERHNHHHQQELVDSRHAHHDTLVHRTLSQGVAGGPGAGQDDSGSSGYGGSPRQDTNVPGSASSTTVAPSLNPGAAGSLVSHLTPVFLPSSNTSGTTLSRPPSS